ncbi:tRNA(1)(Val) (adenine(37)-N(6))-methyltransferase TrmN [Musicola paradisiaca]|uniref:tRNA1(Val) (adenine(37)-N6)-methyltransferase n=1 Tax=Musicola paradisiaca (strain Ech703) TaxID=579405 RepID=TRMN6_MUSP7|nr:tRNA1(Val) (adenine(37)-N6)-methyltransferase [Musicola paradisiaca]C6CB42.1 RecName: Full=tRNA1(Val) (adenine(37)-N6)-methyltransferase; AltName: Full=tRNA m6A37 methyltransferase [Musicola paradisiaca Ech703]ACS86570.1 methyltransferase small [Musicola paradisiaca Ech703]
MSARQHTPDLRADGFTFKRFFIAHDRCAMKVGTDGILLGAWAPLRHESRILDVGCGSALISLMLAQRCEGRVPVDAVELDIAASVQAAENVAASPWRDTVVVHQADIVEFSCTTPHRYSLVVSNPPYFAAGVACASPQRTQARYTSSLSHEALLHSVSAVLMPEGRFCVVLPSQIVGDFLFLAESLQWHLALRVDVADNPRRPVHRVLLALTQAPIDPVYSSALLIRDELQQYSPDYRALTQDFYLSM